MGIPATAAEGAASQPSERKKKVVPRSLGLQGTWKGT